MIRLGWIRRHGNSVDEGVDRADRTPAASGSRPGEELISVTSKATGDAATRSRLTDLRQALRRFAPRLAGLQGRLILPYVILTMLIAMVGTYVITRLVTSSVRERFTNQLYEASRVAADELVRRERSHLANLRLMSFTEGVAQALEAGDRTVLTALLTPLALNYEVAAVSAVDLDGREVLTLLRDPDTGQMQALQGSDFSDFAPVVNVLQERVDELGDKYSGMMPITNYGAYMFTSAPVHVSGDRLVGVLMVGSRLQDLLVGMKAQALGDMLVLDESGKLMVSTLVEPEEGFAILELTPEEASSLTVPLSREVTLYGRRFQVVYTPMLLRRQQIGELGVALPSSYVVSAEATSRNTFAWLFSAGTGVVIALGYWLAQSIARPIMRLRDMTQAVASGDLEQASGMERPDEIGELASAFDTMTLKLRERTAEAARLYDETVKRNRELAEINQRLQETQQQLIQSEKLAAVGQLTAGIVHDVKNPLAVIKGLAEELKEEPSIPVEARVHLDSIRANAGRASAIVTDLLTFARQSTPAMVQRDICEAVRASLRLTEYLTRKGKVTVVTDLPDTTVLVTYDPQQIEQVLINLINNAVQAMPDGGTLRVTLRQAGEAVAIAIQDTGNGIPPENLSRVFDPFFTTKKEAEGTGLGLSVSYGIVTHHHGRLDVESQVGQGSTFTVLLPVEQESTG